jgi:hypothetical protein
VTRKVCNEAERGASGMRTFRRGSGYVRIILCGRWRATVNKALKEFAPEFDKMYSKVGRPSIPAGAVATRSVVAAEVTRFKMS